MSDKFQTEQEAFWAGEFGSEYIQRNQGAELLAANLALFSRALQGASKPKDCMEFGANIGMNIRTLQLLFPKQEQFAIEINADAVAVLRTILPPENVLHQSVLDFAPTRKFELVLIKGVLIHINPEYLSKVYDALYKATGRYLLVCEYFNPTPVEVVYRGSKGRLFKRDFCGELLDAYPDLSLIDYGFVYKRDANFPQDDCNWFLMEKRG